MSERTTTIVSALVALAILGLGVTARPTGDQLSGRVESLESDLRFQIEMSWRHDGRTRAARHAQLEETLAAWKASPQTDGDRLLLEKWLREAIVGSLPGESGEFPPPPAFSELIVEAKKPAAKPVEKPTAKGGRRPADAVAAGSETTGPGASPLLPREIRLKPAQAYAPPRAKEFHITPRVPGSRQATVPPAPPQRVIAAKPADAPPAAPTGSKEPVRSMNQTRPAPPQAIASRPLAAPSTQTPPVEPKETAASKIETLPVESKPVMANMGRRELPASTIQERPATPVTVNLAELNAQIGGYHDGLDEIEATVVAGRGKLTEGQVARLVGQLELLAGQYQFVRLYYDGLNEREKAFVAEPRRMLETIDLVDNQRAALVAEDEDFLTTLEGAAAEDELGRRLKAVAEEVGTEREAEPRAVSDR